MGVSRARRARRPLNQRRPTIFLSYSHLDADFAQRLIADLQQVARSSEIELKWIKGTRDVSTIGGPDHVIRVVMDGERMNAFGVTPQDLSAALKVGNALQSSGSLVAGNKEMLVQTGAYLESAADVRKLVVAVRGEAKERKPVFMGDVAQIEDGPNQPTKYVWFGNKDGESPAVTVQISKKPGVNAADVANGVIARTQRAVDRYISADEVGRQIRSH